MHKSQRNIKRLLTENEKLITDLGLTAEYTKNHWSHAFEILRWATCRFLLTVHASQETNETQIRNQLESFQRLLIQLANLEGEEFSHSLIQIHDQWPASKEKMKGWGCI